MKKIDLQYSHFPLPATLAYKKKRENAHGPPFNGTPKLDARLRALLAERAALTERNKKSVGERKKNNRGSGQHSTNHATAASACQIQQREGFLLKRRGQPLINTVIPREQSRQSATQQPGPTFQQLATFPIPISASSGPINEHNLPRSLCVSVNARNSCNAVWRRERALKMHVRYFC